MSLSPTRELALRQLFADLSADGVQQIEVKTLPDGRLTRADAAIYLGIKEQTLRTWAISGRGPRSVKVGGKVFYFRSDLDLFVRRGGED